MTIGIISLGCPKNLVDTEVMLGLLTQAGHVITPNAGVAEAIIVNTCCFIAPAREEGAQAVREALELKRRGACRFVIIAGCWPQREGARLADEFPGVDALVGVSDFPRIAEILEGLPASVPSSAGAARSAPRAETARPALSALHISPPGFLYSDETPRVLATPPWTAYLKIAEGCDHRCAFCVIPQLRGRLRSRPLESIVAEARDLAQRGVREINLIAQDTTSYGRDLYGRQRICDVLRELAAVEDVRWLRLMYCHPAGVTDELISLLRDEPRLCKYIDLPVQHSEREILRAMRRPGSGAPYLKLLQRLRDEVPGIAIRTSILVGFPGETNKHFGALLDFLAAARFDRAGAFVYSPERGTAAEEMPRQVPPAIAQERYRRVMELQQSISLERNREWVGQEMEVLVEAPAADSPRGVDGCESRARPREAPFSWVARSHRDAPEIDGLVYLRGGERAGPGEYVRARITAAREYDLEGMIVGPASARAIQ